MKKILSLFAAMLVAFAAYADPVALPAVLDISNVSFRSENMPDFVIEDGEDYAGTYFDMGAHDSSNDTLLYAEWDVTIEPIKYNIAADVYNTNSWRLQLYLLNQAGDTVKSLRYKGSSGDKGQFAIGSMDMSDLAAGDYKLRARAATAWSKMKLKDIIFEADYSGVPVALPGTLQPAYALLSANASVTNGAIAFKPGTAPDEYATWNVSFAVAGNYNVSIDYTSPNTSTYGVALLSADGQTEIASVAEASTWKGTGFKSIGNITVPAAGNYVVKLTNATQWSEAVLNRINIGKVFLAGDMTDWANHLIPMEEVAANLYKADINVSGYHEFKIVDYGNWKGYANDNDHNVNTNLTELPVDKPSENDNFKIEIPVGTTHIYWDASAQKVYVKCDIDFNSNVLTVVGAESLMGVNWDPAASANDMTYNNDSTYTLVRNNVKLWKGANYGYKVAFNDGWNPSFGGENNADKILNVSENGVYNITFTFDWRTKVVSANATLAPIDLADGYYLIGNIGGVSYMWNIYDLNSDRLLTVNPGNTSEYMVTTTLVADDELQVVEVENNAIKTWFPGGEGNNYIISSQTGLKTIFFRPAKDGGDGWHHGCIYIGSPIYIRAAVADVWGSICLPYDATLSNAKAYYIAEPANPTSGTITVQEWGNDIEAGNTYLIKALADGNIVANLTDGVKATTPVEVNGLIGNLAVNPALLAVNEDYDYYILSGGEFHLIAGTATASVAQYKGYLRIAKNSLAPSQLRIVEAENNTTDVKSVEANEKAVKFFENGQLRILRDGVVYDATGRVVR